MYSEQLMMINKGKMSYYQ